MNVKCTVGTAILTLVVGMTGVAMARDPVQIRINRDDLQFGPSLDPRQHGYEHAYRDGADRGRFDREHGVSYHENAKGYYDETRGYQSFMGSKGQYKQGYREGYKAGYDSAFRDVAGDYGRVYGRSEAARNQWEHPSDPYAPRKWGATDLAFDTGYRDGVTAGQYDRGRNSRPDFEATDAYRNGNHGYGNGYGESASYQAHYRTGFERGYRDGFGRRR